MFQDKRVISSFNGLFGIRVEVGSSLFVLALLFVGLSFDGDPIWAASVFGMLVLSIYLHELGHAWGSLVQGIPVVKIMIHGGGGYCQSARSGTSLEQELVVAMGPIVNLTLWSVTSLLLPDRADVFASDAPHGLIRLLYPYLSFFALINLALGLFNLIPVQPLDGGRLLRLMLLRWMNVKSATQAAGAVGLVFSIVWWPVLIYFFVTTGWLLFFFPSIRLHLAMVRAKAR